MKKKEIIERIVGYVAEYLGVEPSSVKVTEIKNGTTVRIGHTIEPCVKFVFNPNRPLFWDETFAYYVDVDLRPFVSDGNKIYAYIGMDFNQMVYIRVLDKPIKFKKGA